MLERLTEDQREQWSRGNYVTIDGYLARYPELPQSPETLLNLIRGEITLRTAGGEHPTLADYVARYPVIATVLDSVAGDADSTLVGGQLSARPANPLDAAADETLAPGAADAFSTLAPSGLKPTESPAQDSNETLPPTSGKRTAERTVVGRGASAPHQPERRVATTIVGGAQSAQEAGATIAFERRAPKQPDANDGLSEEMRAMLEGRPYIPGYEITGELGRGGMGVVYRALQLSTKRLVALKVVRNEVLETVTPDERAATLERFRHEAQAAARLEHDNIVTVYEVNEVRGLRYYAMRYVTGRSLIEFLRDGPLENRRAAGYIEPIARGLQSAHDKGILHRDLKPHNIMIDEQSDRPLLTDFGLAKIMDHGQELTMAGEIMGTPAYMSPEQARDAGKVTAAADLYSLGATFYHLLTARPPFQAAGIAETLRQINDDEPVAPRQLNPAIDRDLETICLKCLQKEPAKRYPDCRALAEDLGRYLKGVPILARPVGLPERLWRWCRRNPVLAGLSATAAALAVIAIAATVIGYRNTAAALVKTDAALVTAETEKKKADAALVTAEARLKMALGVVEELFTRVSEDELLNEPGMQGLRKDLLGRALKHYQYFLSESGGDAAVRDETAAARFRVGMIAQLTGERDEARKQIDAAAVMQRELLDQNPQDVARIKALATSLNALGNLADRDDPERAIAYFTQAEILRAKLDALHPGNIEYARLLANTRMNIALIEAGRGNEEAARKLLDQAEAARREILQAHPDERKTRRDLAKGYFGWAFKLDEQHQRSADAIRYFQDAEREFSLLLKNDERSLDDRYLLGQTRRWLGWKFLGEKRLPEARQAYEAARTVTEALAAGNPDVEKYQIEAATLALDRGDLYTALADWPTAREALTHAREKLNSIARKNPKSWDSLRLSAGASEALADVELNAGDPVASRTARVEAIETLRRLLKESPDDPDLQEGIKENERKLPALDPPK